MGTNPKKESVNFGVEILGCGTLAWYSNRQKKWNSATV